MKVFVLYPPGELFQRGEDRCQMNIKSSAANEMRACNDLGYMASVLRTYGDDVFLRDYATEKKAYEDVLTDLRRFLPDYIVLSTTNTTVFKDIEFLLDIKRDCKYKGKIILKGAIFYEAPDILLQQLNLTIIDFLIGGEVEWVIGDLIHQKKPYKDIPCIFFKNEHGWNKTDFSVYNQNLDGIPFPARDLMNNELYVRPDTGEPMATIQTGHGCPSNCIYCLTPQISGKRLRLRSPKNVLDEMIECYEKYHIRNFFFRADTFTYDRKWVLELCEMIKASILYGKIQYTANSRVKPLSEDLLRAMKETGCFMIVFGLETGSEDTINRIKKGVTQKDNFKAVKMAKAAGIPVCGFFMMGFPWETKKHLSETRGAIIKLDCDFIEIHIALPYYGTELYEQCRKSKVLAENILGRDVFHATTNGTRYLSERYVLKYRSHTLLLFYLRPKYIVNKIREANWNRTIIKNYVKFGIRLVRNLLSS